MPSAHVLSIQALAEFKSTLNRFNVETLEAFNAAEMEIRRTADWLQERLNYWQGEVQRCREEARRAESALASCRASGYRDPRTGMVYTPPCIAEQQAVHQARLRLQKAEAELNNIRRWKYLFDEAASAYSIQAQQMKRFLSTDIPNAAAFLGKKVDELQAYVAATLPAGAGITSPAFTTTFSTPTAGMGSGLAAGWIDTGIQDVDLALVDLSDSPVADTGEFHKVSAQEMEEGLRKLQDVVAPAVAQGADGDYFSRLDATQGLDYAHGYRRIYDAFYGQDCIRLDKVGDRYQVVNGHHRLFVARQMGIKTLPARVIAGQP